MTIHEFIDHGYAEDGDGIVRQRRCGQAQALVVRRPVDRPLGVPNPVDLDPPSFILAQPVEAHLSATKLLAYTKRHGRSLRSRLGAPNSGPAAGQSIDS